MESELIMLDLDIRIHFTPNDKGELFHVHMLPVFQWGKDFTLSKNSTLKMYTPREWMEDMLNRSPKHNYFLIRLPLPDQPKREG